MAMFRPNILWLCLSIALSGCATPLTQSWDDPLYVQIIQDYSDEDIGAGKETSSRTRVPADMPMFAQMESLSLADAIAVALANHPRLRAAAYDIRAAQGRETQARLGPNPSFGLGPLPHHLFGRIAASPSAGTCWRRVRPSLTRRRSGRPSICCWQGRRHIRIRAHCRMCLINEVPTSSGYRMTCHVRTMPLEWSR